MDQWSYSPTHMSVGSEPGSARIVGPKASFNRLQRTDPDAIFSIGLFSCLKGSAAPVKDWVLLLSVGSDCDKRGTTMIIVGEESTSVVTHKLVNRRSVTISPSWKRPRKGGTRTLRPDLSGAEHARSPPHGGRSAVRQIPTRQEGERGAEMVNELRGYHTSSTPFP